MRLFETILHRLSASARQGMDRLVNTEGRDEAEAWTHSPFSRLKDDPNRLGLNGVLEEVEKLATLQRVHTRFVQK
jgi:hypothetical protein